MSRNPCCERLVDRSNLGISNNLDYVSSRSLDVCKLTAETTVGDNCTFLRRLRLVASFSSNMAFVISTCSNVWDYMIQYKRVPNGLFEGSSILCPQQL